MMLTSLDTPRLTLRPVAETDRDYLVAALTDVDLMTHMNGALTPDAAAALFARILDPGSGNRTWIAEERGTGEPCGHCALKPPGSEEDEGLEILYVVQPPYQGRGIATEMAGRVAAFAFTALDVPRLVATVDLDHAESRRVLERLGFTEIRRDMDRHGPFRVYDLTREAWEERDHRLPPGAASGGAADDPVVRRFLDGERLVRIPARHAKRMAVLAWLADRFETGREYTEIEVNAVLRRHHEDVASLRRHLVDHGFLSREHGVYNREEVRA